MASDQNKKKINPHTHKLALGLLGWIALHLSRPIHLRAHLSRWQVNARKIVGAGVNKKIYAGIILGLILIFLFSAAQTEADFSASPGWYSYASGRPYFGGNLNSNSNLMIVIYCTGETLGGNPCRIISGFNGQTNGQTYTVYSSSSPSYTQSPNAFSAWAGCGSPPYYMYIRDLALHPLEIGEFSPPNNIYIGNVSYWTSVPQAGGGTWINGPTFQGGSAWDMDSFNPFETFSNCVPPPAPTINFFANPGTIIVGGQSTLNWTTSDANFCTTSGGWSGSQPTSGSQAVSPSTTTTYNLRCTGLGGSTDRSVTVNVNQPAPVLNFSANLTTINAGAQSALNWAATDATTCTASGGWSGMQSTNGTLTVTPSSTTTYDLQCTGPGGSDTRSVTIIVTQPLNAICGSDNGQALSAVPTNLCSAGTPSAVSGTGPWNWTCTGANGGTDASCSANLVSPPTITFAANPDTITSGDQSTLDWAATDATTCTAGGGWSGMQSTNGTLTVTPSSTTTYDLQCTGPGGSDTRSVTITVNQPPTPAPTLTFAASSGIINTGSQTTLNWTSTNATTCTASGGWSGTQAISGTITITPSGTTTYDLQCTGPSGNITQSVTVTVNPVSGNPPPPPPPPQSNQSQPSIVPSTGLVPCGGQGDPCTLCHLIIGFNRMVQYGLYIVLFLAILAIVIAGIMYITSAGSEPAIQKAKSYLKAAFVGFAVVLAAWLIVYVILQILTAKGDLGIGQTNWYTFTCRTQRAVQPLQELILIPPIFLTGNPSVTPPTIGDPAPPNLPPLSPCIFGPWTPPSLFNSCGFN